MIVTVAWAVRDRRSSRQKCWRRWRGVHYIALTIAPLSTEYAIAQPRRQPLRGPGRRLNHLRTVAFNRQAALPR